MTAADETLRLESLTAFLADDYAKLRLYMGDTMFNAVGRRCLATYALEARNIRTLSRHMPDFLDLTKPFSRSPELSDLARLERAFHAARNAPDAIIVSGLPHPLVPGLYRFDFHPSIQRLQLRTNATSIWSALTAGEQPPPPAKLAAPLELLVWRQGAASRFRMLGQEEALALDEAAHGEVIRIDHSSESFLRGWIEAEIISSLRTVNDSGG